jgi:hypothetical protein
VANDIIGHFGAVAEMVILEDCKLEQSTLVAVTTPVPNDTRSISTGEANANTRSPEKSSALDVRRQRSEVSHVQLFHDSLLLLATNDASKAHSSKLCAKLGH